MIQIQKIKELPITIIDGDRSSRYPKRGEFRKKGILFLNTANIVQNRLDLTEANYVSSEKFDEIRKGRLQRYDIVMTTRGSIGKVALFDSNPPAGLINAQMLILRADGEVLDQKFLFYQFCSDDFQIKLSNFASGSAQPQLPIVDLKEIEIGVPPLPTQRKIAAILGNYDDLIENNTRRIKILEEMAGTIYREWFVEFRFPGHENVKMEESELGLIPQGWELKFSDYVDFKEGPGLRRWQYRDEGIPFLNIRTLADNSIDSSKLQYLEPDEVTAKYSHFLLAPYDHVVSSSGTLGRIVTIQRGHLPLMLNTSIIRMRAKTENVGTWQLKHFLKSDYFQWQINALATGTAQKNYGPSHLEHMKIVTPDPAIGAKYETIVNPLEELLGLLVMKNANLRKTRDLLLPKLISGELDVSELDINTDGTQPRKGGTHIPYPLTDRLHSDEKILNGKPVIKGTRLAVEFIIDLLEHDWSNEDILENYPNIVREDIEACRVYQEKVVNASVSG